jgi:hypothetical protein
LVRVAEELRQELLPSDKPHDQSFADGLAEMAAGLHKHFD